MKQLTPTNAWAIASLLVALAAAAPSVQAITYGFDNISANNLNDAAIGEAQLSVDVTDPGSGQVLFTFNNAGPEASSITDVYFDDGHLLGISTIVGSSGVSYSPGASPGNLPSANSITPSFQTSAGFSADSDPATQPNGVNPGEWLEVYFDLKTGKTFDDIIADLANGSLRIGIHVQGFASGGSESFVNDGPRSVPDASATCMLLGMGLMGLETLRRRTRRNRQGY